MHVLLCCLDWLPTKRRLSRQLPRIRLYFLSLSFLFSLLISLFFSSFHSFFLRNIFNQNFVIIPCIKFFLYLKKAVQTFNFWCLKSWGRNAGRRRSSCSVKRSLDGSKTSTEVSRVPEALVAKQTLRVRVRKKNGQKMLAKLFLLPSIPLRGRDFSVAKSIIQWNGSFSGSGTGMRLGIENSHLLKKFFVELVGEKKKCFEIGNQSEIHN